MPDKLSKDEEKKFQDWYKGHSKKLNLNPNPDDPLHFYDYKAAFKAGVEPNEEGHWPSKFKSEDHPNRVIKGKDTATGKQVDHVDYTGPLRKKTYDEYFKEASEK